MRKGSFRIIGNVVVVVCLSAFSCGVSDANIDSTTGANDSVASEVRSSRRGVTFFYLDGASQDFPWILANQSNATVRARIDNVLSAYRTAGVNWIRLLVAADHFGSYSQSWPNVNYTNTLVSQLNNFLAITRSDANAGAFNVEIVLVTKHKAGDLFFDSAPYLNDKAWITQILNGINYGNVGMVLLSGDATPCGWSAAAGAFRCEGEAGVTDHDKNHGEWIKTVWPWARAKWPSLAMSYEVVVGEKVRDYELLKKSIRWIKSKTPSVPVIAMPLYFDQPQAGGPASGSPSSAWSARTREFFAMARSEAGTTPIWIDEFGLPIDIDGVAPAEYTEIDQRSAIEGFLVATQCEMGGDNGAFAWVAGNDFPYNQKAVFGLLRGFSNNTPLWRSAWTPLSYYFQRGVCPSAVPKPTPTVAIAYSNNFDATTALDGFAIWYNCAKDANYGVSSFAVSGAPSGSFVMRMQSTGFVSGCAAPGLFAQTQDIGATAGATYTLRTKSRNASNVGRRWLIFLKNGVQLSATSGAMATDAWSFNDDNAVVAIAPVGTTHFVVRFELATPTEYADIDNVTVEKKI